MPIQFQVLGAPGRDNALLAEVHTGDAVHRLLFDCGEGCVSELPISVVHQIESVFFSHFHIDHIAGFDAFFRHNFGRPDAPVRIFGPLGTCDVMAHRFRGFTWNLVADAPGEFQVTEVAPPRMITQTFYTKEGFAVAHLGPETPFQGWVWEEADFRVEAHLLDHGMPCLAYLVREAPRWNFHLPAVAELGLRPGPWMRAVRGEALADENLTIDGKQYALAELRSRLMRQTPGESIAYLTDFRLDDAAEERLVAWLAGCDTLVCENNFRNADRQLAENSFHLISADVARLARRVNPRRLVLFHLSDRYTANEWREQREEVRTVFPRTEFPAAWKL
jgi:ribonuclease Z